MVKKVVVRETITESTEESSVPGAVVSKPANKKRVYTKKKVESHASVSTPKKKMMTAREREEMLIENFVGLQHAMTNLSIKFGALSDNISSLLAVFEEAARNFAAGGRPDDKDMLKKINALLEQNKTIARGLVLMESKLRGRATDSSDSGQGQSTPNGFSPSIASSDTERPRPRPLPSI